MDTTPFLIDVLVNGSFFTEAFVDSGCLCFSAFCDKFARKHKLPRIPIDPRVLKLADNDETGQKKMITHLTFIEMDVDGRKERIYGYIIENLRYKMILGKPWMEQNDVLYHSADRKLTFGDSPGLEVKEKGWEHEAGPLQARIAGMELESAGLMSGAYFMALAKRHRNNPEAVIGAATIHDITKALEVKSKLTIEETRDALPEEIKEFAGLFTDDDEGERALSPHRPGLDTNIKLEKDECGREKPVPHGPLYGMSREELLVLRKTLADLLDKNWIRASSSPGGAPVLFAKKPGGGLRFCVDYRALNSITVKDRYPLPLIKETLRTVARAKWVSKVDVRAAFHRLRVQKGDEWKTAFRTRFGACEYLVTPFGLAGAPAAFQRWINTVPKDYLGDFCSAYMDDVLIYTDGDLNDHWIKLKLVLTKLEEAGLKLDLKKSEFAVKRTKYLGFIIELGKGICVDPEKVAAIREWQPPTSVK